MFPLRNEWQNNVLKKNPPDHIHFVHIVGSNMVTICLIATGMPRGKVPPMTSQACNTIKYSSALIRMNLGHQKHDEDASWIPQMPGVLVLISFEV